MTNFSMKDISKIINEFEKLLYKGYVCKRSKHEPTDSYFYLAIQIAKCVLRADAFNSQIDPIKKEMTGTQHIPILYVYSLDESESKGFIADENLSQVCSTYESESESVIVDEISTEESESVSVQKSINTNNEEYAID